MKALLVLGALVAGTGATASAANQYAQACLRNDVEAKRVSVWTNWGIGDRWHQVILGPGTSMVYRLTLDEAKPELTFNVRYHDRRGGEAVEQKLPSAWSEVPSADCAALPQYKFVKAINERGEAIVTLVPVTGAEQGE